MSSFLDICMAVMFTGIGLSVIMLLYLMINLIQSVRMLTALIAGINSIISRANSMVTGMTTTLNRFKEIQGVVSLVAAIGIIGISNHFYKKIKKLF